MSRGIASGNGVNYKGSGSGSGSGGGCSFDSGSGAGYSNGYGDVGNYGFGGVFETQEYNGDGYGRGRSCGAGSKYYGIGRTL